MKETELLLVRRLLQNEIDRLHDFFVEWFTGTIEDSNSSVFTSSVERSMDANFHLVNPQGVMTSREPLLKALKDAYGCRRGQVFRIQCQNLQLLQQHQESTNSSTSAASTITTYLVSYEECQQVQETNTARIVSAWFVRVQKQQKEDDNNKNKNDDGSKKDNDDDHDDDDDDDILKWKHVHETWMPGMGPPSESHMWTPKESSK